MEALGVLFVFLLALVVAYLFYHWVGRRGRVREEGPSPYVQSLQALLAGDQDEAFRRLKEVVSRDTDNVDAYIRLGDLFRQRGQIEKAIQVHQYLTVRTSLPPRVETQIYRSLAQDYLAAGTRHRALSLLEERLRLDSQDPDLLEMLRGLYEQEGRWDDASRMEGAALQARKSDEPHRLARYLTYVGEQKMKGGDEAGSVAAFRQALQLDRNCLWTLLYLGDLQYHQGRVEQAISLWQRAVAAHPSQAHLTFERLERAYYDLGRFEEITHIYEGLLRRNPKDFRTMLAQADIERKKGNLAESTRLCQRAVESAPHSVEARLSLLQSRLQEDRTSRESLNLVSDLLAEHRKHSCSRCGFSAEDLFVRCPACQCWREEGPQ